MSLLFFVLYIDFVIHIAVKIVFNGKLLTTYNG